MLAVHRYVRTVEALDLVAAMGGGGGCYVGQRTEHSGVDSHLVCDRP